MHKYHETTRRGGVTGHEGTMLQRQSEALNTGPTRYMSLHHTHNLYIKERRPQYIYVQAALVRENEQGTWSHAREGLACLLSIGLCPHLSHKVTWDHDKSAGLSTVLGSPAYPGCQPLGSLQEGMRCPELRTLEPSVESHPWELPGKGPAGREGRDVALVRQRREVQPAAGQVWRVAWLRSGRQDWLWRHPLLQAKLKTARQACVSLQLSSDRP